MQKIESKLKPNWEFIILKDAPTVMLNMSFDVHFTDGKHDISTSTVATPRTTKSTPTTTKSMPTTMPASTDISKMSTASLTTQRPVPTRSKYLIFKLCFKE